MRIAYVINSLEGGGAALPVPAVTRIMRDHGAAVTVYALTPRDLRAQPAIVEAGVPFEVRAGGEKDHLAAWWWLEDRMRRARPDVIWTSLTRATLIGQQVGRRLGIPVVSWQHAAYLKPANRVLLRAMRHLSALWVADSTSVGRLTAERLAVPPERLAVWPIFGADPDAPRARPWSPDQVLRIGTLGRLHPVKGYDVLIEALARLAAQDLHALPKFEVSIAGDGAQRAALAARIAAARLDNVHLAGFTARPREYLAGLHLYVQPSRSEGLCVAAHEAMQAGLPTVVSAVGELPYSVLDGVTGLVVPPDDADQLMQALQFMLSRPERLATMGAGARARVLDTFGPAAFSRAGAAVMARLPQARASGRGPGRGRSPIHPANDRPA